MSDVPEIELFSAYLDGELTADEQVRAEQIMATSSEARRLLEELRALNSTLQGLPQQELDEDLSARVLQVAERRMLLPDDAGHKPAAGRAAESLDPLDSSSPDGGTTRWRGIPWREISWRGMISKRALIWSAVVVSTAIIIAFTSPPPQKPNQDPRPNQEIARLDAENTPRIATASGDKRSKEPAGEASWDAPAPSQKPEARGTLAMAEKRKAADAIDRAVATEAEGLVRVEKARKSEDKLALKKSASAAGGEGPLHDGLVRAGGVQVAEKVAKSDEKSGGSAVDAVAPPKPTVVAPQLAAAAPSTPSQPDEPAPAAHPDEPTAAAARLGENSLRQSVTMSKGAATAGAQRRPGKVPADNAEIADNTVSRGGAASQLMNGSESPASNGNSSPAETMAAGNFKVDQAQDLGDGQKAPAATVVRLDVSSLAVQDKVFESMLARSGLGSNPGAANNELRAFKDQGNLQSRVGTANSQYAVASNSHAEKPGAGLDHGGALKQQAPQPIVFECVASQEQLDLLIKQIRQNSDSFSVPRVEAGNSDSPAVRSIVQSNRYGAGNDRGLGGGGGSASRSGEQQQAKAEAKAVDSAREEAVQGPRLSQEAMEARRLKQEKAVQSPATPAPAPLAQQATSPPATGAARQHVVFVLNVVDRIAPAAGRAPPIPAAAAPAKRP